ncbi:MAG: NAD(P)/FAD-dependent oxidoreductase [Wujia sp.]
MLRINQIKLPVEEKEDKIRDAIKRLIKTDNFKIKAIVRRSLDARKKDNLLYIYSIDIESDREADILKRNKNNNNIMSITIEKYRFPCSCSRQLVYRPVIIGTGPAGYFCGLYLARNGYKPIIFERGKPVEERTRDVDEFWNNSVINPNSNVSFGEGGAGTFSDGKLNTGIKDKQGRIEAILEDFISFGADSEIAYNNKPHVGTDVLKNIMKNMREEIISLGGTICFEHIFSGFEKQKDVFVLDIENLKDNKKYKLNTNVLVLAIGHSARDTFKILNEKSVPMEQKAFAIGIRIQHKREMIDEAQYGTSPAAKMLPAADYKMTYRSSEGRSVYSFCMCPGGYVVNASSDKNQTVVNGMSYHGRDSESSNSAIVVNVTPEDFIAEGFGEYGVLAGVEYQKKYEGLAYKAGQGAIPVQLFGDFKRGVISSEFGSVRPCMKGDYRFSDLNNCLPEYVKNAIIEGIISYDERLKGFGAEDAILAGVETRTSSPVRICRDESLMSEIKGLFPCGEGAGYAGGITSAAVDGIRVAEAVAAYLNNIQ